MSIVLQNFKSLCHMKVQMQYETLQLYHRFYTLRECAQTCMNSVIFEIIKGRL